MMMTSRLDSIVQLITALLIFVFVLALAYFTTKFTAGIQKGKLSSTNVEIVETFKLSTNKILQIIKVGETYYSIVSCKDTVTCLGEIPEEQLDLTTVSGTAMSFQEILNKAKQFKTKK